MMSAANFVAPTPTLPTNYEYYTNGGITNGLSANQSYFTLNDRNISLYSGAMHYFRTPQPYWRDRLRKMRAAGLNTVETYVPWNLHEPENNYFDFGAGGSDWQPFLDVAKFVKTAQEEDLFVLVRPGPFICAEWEFGGFPSWLLRERGIKLRTSDPTYMYYVRRYFNVLLTLLTVFQFTNGGPIVGFQVENEYGSTLQKGKFLPDKQYLRQLRTIFLQNGIKELLYTSDGSSQFGAGGTLPEYFLQTSNFANNPELEFGALAKLQANKPTMAMEYWAGWFDHWSDKHQTRSEADFNDTLQRIIKYPASVNMYMFHGGTSFGFLNGANINNGKSDNSGYQPDTTSYDYDAPLTENGDYTVKYVIVKELLDKYTTIKTKLPITPALTPRIAYPAVPIVSEMLLDDILENADVSFTFKNMVTMEMLPMNNYSGQSYGYIVYQKKQLYLAPNSVLEIPGYVYDTVVVIVNGKRVNAALSKLSDLNGFGYYRKANGTIILNNEELKEAKLELLVENWGRNNYGHLDQFDQRKGLRHNVRINGVEVTDWVMFALEFKKRFNNQVIRRFSQRNTLVGSVPALYTANFEVTTEIMDTWIDMQEWTKGIVIVNGFVLGRYARIGPQQTLYLPAPFLKAGNNTILIFEHFVPANEVRFSNKPIFKTASN